jgi:hypothetical protein
MMADVRTERAQKKFRDPGSNLGRGANFLRRKREVRIRPDNKFSGCEFKSLFEQLETASNTLSQAKVEELRSVLIKALRKRFKQPREPKYGSISKAFTEKELQLFMRNVKNVKFRLLFRYQA